MLSHSIRTSKTLSKLSDGPETTQRKHGMSKKEKSNRSKGRGDTVRDEQEAELAFQSRTS